MGIRIVKSMGYGFDDYDPDGDDRINPEILDVDAEIEKQEEFLEWVLSEEDEVLELLSEFAKYPVTEYKFTLFPIANRPEKDRMKDRVIDYSQEMGGSNVFTICPFDKAPFWRRYNDDIDYYYHRASGFDFEPQVLNVLTSGVSTGFYAWDKKMFLKPGKRDKFFELSASINKDVEKLADEGMDARLYKMLVGDPFEEKGLAPDEFRNHLLEDWHVEIPVDILAFLHFCDFFTDFKYAYDLKPLVHTYWS